eukprot:747574-Hanusia_phi.AAC.16
MHLRSACPVVEGKTDMAVATRPQQRLHQDTLLSSLLGTSAPSPVELSQVQDEHSTTRGERT